jgi:hypothetical protein
VANPGRNSLVTALLVGRDRAMVSGSAAWCDAFYQAKDYGGEGEQVTALGGLLIGVRPTADPAQPR